MAKTSASTAEQASLLDPKTPASAPAVVAPASNGLLVAFAQQLEQLDQFATDNNLVALTEGKGSFTAALAVADAIGQLKVMLTPEIMKPIMALQGTTLGFKTDMDKEGGYKVDVVRDCFIEATLRGFQMVNNQTNIIGGRAYQTKEGFEAWALKQAKLGRLTDYRDAYSTPRQVSENEAVVKVSATWVWLGKADKMENVDISIRVNKGQGADAILGKAKRKLLARIYTRVTGTVITEGDANEATVIDVDARKVADAGAAGKQPDGGSGTTGPVMASEEQKQLLREIVGDKHAEKANAWLLAHNAIPKDGSYLDVSAKTAAKIIGDSKAFFTAIGAE